MESGSQSKKGTSQKLLNVTFKSFLATQVCTIPNGGWILVEMVIKNDRQDISPAYMVLLVSMPRDSILVVGCQFQYIQHPFAFLLLVTHSNQVLYCIVCRRECYQALNLTLG